MDSAGIMIDAIRATIWPIAAVIIAEKICSTAIKIWEGKNGRKS